MLEIIVALALLAGGFFLSEYGDTFSILLQTIGMLLLLHGFPTYINEKIVGKYPDFGALIKGDKPYDELSALPKRVILVGMYAVFLVILGLTIVVSMYFGIAAIKQENLTKRGIDRHEVPSESSSARSVPRQESQDDPGSLDNLGTLN